MGDSLYDISKALGDWMYTEPAPGPSPAELQLAPIPALASAVPALASARRSIGAGLAGVPSPNVVGALPVLNYKDVLAGGPSGTPALDPEDQVKVTEGVRAGVEAGRPVQEPLRASDIVAAKPSQHAPTLRENWTLPTGTASVNRGVGTGGKEWLREQVDPSQLRVSADGAIEGPTLHQEAEGGADHAGRLFMGAGTQADLEGKMNLQAVFDEEEKRRAARSLTEAQAEDPFGIGVAQQKANIEYLFGTGRDVAKAKAESLGAQDVEYAKGAAKFAGSDLLVSQHDQAVAALKDPGMIDPETKGPITPRRRAELLARVEAVFNSQYELHKLGLTSGYPPFQFPPLETKTETPASTTPPVATPPRAPGT